MPKKTFSIHQQLRASLEGAVKSLKTGLRCVKQSVQKVTSLDITAMREALSDIARELE